MTRRFAMWSGPRNLSTALMRAFGNRVDCAVTDEPLYGHYLSRTGLNHPGAQEIIVSQPDSWQEVSEWLRGPAPGGAPLWYQKHMTHHLLDCVGREWMKDLRHGFLIRDPRAVLASYARTRQEVTLEDLGFFQQAELFDWVCNETGRCPPVIDARDLLQDPEKVLRALCGAWEIAFSPAMLNWPPGPRDTDGIWACHWYASVENSTGFKPASAVTGTLPEEFEEIAGQASIYPSCFTR